MTAAVSPDLNPIENVWEVLRDALKQHPLPPTVTNFLHPVNGMVLMPTHIYLQLAATAPQQSLGDCDSAYIPPSILCRHGSEAHRPLGPHNGFQVGK